MNKSTFAFSSLGLRVVYLSGAVIGQRWRDVASPQIRTYPHFPSLFGIHRIPRSSRSNIPSRHFTSATRQICHREIAGLVWYRDYLNRVFFLKSQWFERKKTKFLINQCGCLVVPSVLRLVGPSFLMINELVTTFFAIFFCLTLSPFSQLDVMWNCGSTIFPFFEPCFRISLFLVPLVLWSRSLPLRLFGICISELIRRWTFCL